MYTEGGPDHKALGRSYETPVPSVYLKVCGMLNKLDSICLNGWAGQGKPSQR